MPIRTSLLAGAGLSALTFPGTADAVAAKPLPRHQVEDVRALKAEVDELRSQVAALTARLNAQDQTQRQAAAVAQAAQQTAEAAAAQARAAQTQVATATAAVPGQVKEALGKQPKPKPSWADATTLSGRMFFNASHIEQTSDGATVGRSNAFDVKRFYLGVDHKFNDVYSASATTDISLIANTNNVTGTANSGAAQPGQGTTAPAAFPKTVGETLYLKKAYLQARYDPAFTLRLGAADLPWVPFVEDVYGYRYVEQILIDRTGFGTSTDWGIHALGTLAGGHVNYAVSVVDGAGYRNPLRSKSLDVEGRLSVNYQGFIAAAGFYAGKRGGDTFTPFSPTNNAVTPVQTGANVQTFHTATRFNALLAYTSDTLRLGGEYFYARNWNQVTKAPSDTSEGWSAFASYRPAPLIGLFARYDWVEPTRDLFPAITDRYFNLRPLVPAGEDRRVRPRLQTRPGEPRLFRPRQQQPLQLRLPDRRPHQRHRRRIRPLRPVPLLGAARPRPAFAVTHPVILQWARGEWTRCGAITAGVAAPTGACGCYFE
jgi:hypothetical protein